MCVVCVLCVCVRSLTWLGVWEGGGLFVCKWLVLKICAAAVYVQEWRQGLRAKLASSDAAKKPYRADEVGPCCLVLKGLMCTCAHVCVCEREVRRTGWSCENASANLHTQTRREIGCHAAVLLLQIRSKFSIDDDSDDDAAPGARASLSASVTASRREVDGEKEMHVHTRTHTCARVYTLTYTHTIHTHMRDHVCMRRSDAGR